MPDGLERIYMDGFSGCTSPKEVVIPENVIMDGYCFTEKDVTLLESLCEFRGRTICPNKWALSTEVIGSHTHNWEEASVANEATCKNEGRAIYRCTICGTTKFEVISKKHTNLEAKRCTRSYLYKKLDIQVTRFAKTAMKYLRQERAFR
ncbi:MAG: hypothetical protein ACLU9T_16515 [Blautia faecis]